MSNAAASASNAVRNGLKTAFNAGKPVSGKLPLKKSVLKDSLRSTTLFTHKFEASPSAINVTTLTPTKIHAEDSFHPFHVKVVRRLAAFDQSKFYWRIHVPQDLSKKAAIRRGAMKRIREAVRKELRNRGYNADGTVKQPGSGAALEGALLVVLDKKPEKTLTASYHDVEKDVKALIQLVVDNQNYTRAVPLHEQSHSRNPR